MYFETLIQEHQQTVDALLKNCIKDIQAMGDLCREVVQNGHTIFFCGNGGSAADCQHIAAEFVGRFVKERRGLPAVAMTTDTSILTSVGNDYGFAYIFKRQVEALVQEGDAVIGISTSGNSQNVVLALEEAKKRGAHTVALTGAKPGGLSKIADVTVQVPAAVTARVQECHILVGHMVCAYVDEAY